MNTTVDNASQCNAVAIPEDSSHLQSKRSGSTNATDLLLKRDAGKDQVCTAGRVSDDGGPLASVKAEPAQAKPPAGALPSYPVISAEHFVQAGSAHDPHGTTLAKAVDHSFGGEPQYRHVSARRSPAPHAAHRSVHASDAVAKAVRTIVGKAQAETNSTKALRALDEGYAKAPQKVKDAILREAALDGSDLHGIFKRAVDDATAPLNATTGTTQEHAHDAMLNLQQATWRLDPELAGAVVSLAMPGFEAFHERNEKNIPGDGLFGPAGRPWLDKMIAHIATSRHGDEVTTRFIAMDVLSYDRGRAVNDVLSATKNLQDTKTQQPGHRNAAAKAELRDGSLQHKVDAAKARLDAVITAEIAGKVSLKSRPGGPTPEAIAEQAGKEIVAGYADESRELVSASVDHVLDSRRAKAEAHKTKTHSP
jgi:hypothetical protein